MYWSLKMQSALLLFPADVDGWGRIICPTRYCLYRHRSWELWPRNSIFSKSCLLFRSALQEFGACHQSSQAAPFSVGDFYPQQNLTLSQPQYLQSTPPALLILQPISGSLEFFPSQLPIDFLESVYLPNSIQKSQGWTMA